MVNNGEFIEVLSSSAFKDVQQLTAEIDKLVVRVNDANRAFKVIKLPSEGKHSIVDMTKASTEQNRVLTETQRLVAKLTSLRQQEALENAKLKVQISDLTKEQKRQAQEALGVLNAYQKLSAELNVLRLDAKGLAADMFNLEVAGQKNSTQYQKLASTYENVAARVNLLDGGLKKIDSSLGQSQRFVGNYATGWNGLGHSINQITREFPAFTYSMQTGFLALSNNLPMVADEINKLVAANKELQAQGKPTVSVLSQIGKALFSWQTLLSAGITILTIYGAKIIEWAKGLGNAATEIDLLREATERYQNTTVETVTNAERQLTTVNRLVSVMKNMSKSDEERASAARDLRQLYPGYLKNLKEEDLLLDANENQTQAYIKAMRQLRKDIQLRVDAESKQNASRENLKIAAEIEQEVRIREMANSELFDLWNKYGQGNEKLTQREREEIQKRIKARQELYEDDKEFASKFGEIYIQETGSISRLGAYSETQITELKQRASTLRQEFQKEQDEINKIFQNTSLLDFKPDNEQSQLQEQAIADYLANAYALRRTELENQQKYQEEIYQNEENGYADREAALKEWGRLSYSLNKLNMDEELRLAEKTNNDEVAQVTKLYEDKKITKENYNQAIKALDKQEYYDRKLAFENFAQAQLETATNLDEALKGVTSKLSEQERQGAHLRQQLDNMRQINQILGNVNGDTSVKDYAEIENRIRKITNLEDDQRKEALRGNREALQTEIDRIQSLEKNAKNNEAINRLKNEQLNIDKELLSIDHKRAESISAVYKQMEESTRQYMESITGGFLSDMGFEGLTGIFDQVTYDLVKTLEDGTKIIETKTGSTFQKMFDQADTMQEKFAVAFNTVTTIAQQAMEFLNQNSQAYFDAQYARLDREHEVAKVFAGKSAEAKEEIDREFEQRRRDIRIKEAKSQKEQALFNAIINTAQAVVAALPNIPLSVLVGALGAAQIAMIASRPLPAFAEGGEHTLGGPMLVNDAPGSNFKEVVQTPDGKIFKPQGRNVIMNAPKGTIVHKNYDAFQESLNAMLMNNSIAPFAEVLFGSQLGNVTIEQNGGITKQDLDSVMHKYSTKKNFNINIDRTGINAYMKEEYVRTINNKNFISIKSKTI